MFNVHVEIISGPFKRKKQTQDELWVSIERGINKFRWREEKRIRFFM